MFEEILSGNLFSMVLVFARFSTAISLFPGISEQYVPIRIKLLFVLAVTVAVAPVVSANLPTLPARFDSLLLLLLGEMGVGFFIGSVMRIFFNTLVSAGTVISMQIGLTSSLILNPLLSDQTYTVGVFMLLLGMVIIFETGLMDMMLQALVKSYDVFNPSGLPPAEDFIHMITLVVSKGFIIAIEMSSPFIAASILLYLSFGLMGRLVPQLQIFFIGLPAQILIGFLTLSFTLSTLYILFREQMENVIRGLTIGS